MSANKKVDSKTSREAKRARFDEKSGGASPLILILGLAVVLTLIGGALFALTRPSPKAAEPQADLPSANLVSYPTGSQGLLVSAATYGHDPYPLAEAENGQVRFALSTFDDHKAHYYTYMHEGRPIEFFVLKSRDGVVRVAFNACDVCFASRKGYRQEGDEMVCNNCGNRFPSNQINEVRGGCNPSPLTRRLEGDTLVILVEDIVEGLGFF
jgi:hypothetical protein